MKYTWCCSTCGKSHGSKVPKLATWNPGICDICGKRTYVTNMIEYGIKKFRETTSAAGTGQQNI